MVLDGVSKTSLRFEEEDIVKLLTAKRILPALLLMGALIYLIGANFSEAVVYYYSVDEYTAQFDELSHRGVRINGKAFGIEKQGTECRFRIGGKGKSLPVVYRGLLPDTFKENADVVVEGTWNQAQQCFEAQTLLAKCPSKYEGKDFQQGHPESE